MKARARQLYADFWGTFTMRFTNCRGMSSGWMHSLTGLAVLAFAVPASAQGLGTGSTGGGQSAGSSGFGLSGGTGGGSGGGSSGGSFGLSGSGSSGTLGMSSSSGTGFGTGTTSSPFGSNSPFGSGTGSGTGGNFGGANSGQFGAGRTGTNQPFFPTATSSNPLGKYYMNPLTPGTLNVSRTATFGQPIYTTVTTTNTSGGARGGAGAGSSGSAGGYMTNTQAPRYGISVESLMPPLGARTVPNFGVSPRAQGEVQGVLTRSTSLSGNRTISVEVDNGLLVLRGKVPSARDREMAEGLALMTPGVNTLRNELQVTP